jgi:hypothetical protein
MSFHNFNSLIARHKRDFVLYKAKTGSKSAVTTRYEGGSYEDGVQVSGCWETITKDDLERNPDLEIIKGNMKILTTPDLMSGIIPDIKDKILYNNNSYIIIKIIDDVYYGNFYRIFLKKENYRVGH